MIHSYKELIVWQKSIQLVIEVYKLTRKYPSEEIYGITSQTRRAAVSIPSNIAEGRYRGTRKDYRQFLKIAYASGAELETLIVISKDLPFGIKLDYTLVDSLLDEVMRMLNKMLVNLSEAKKLDS